MTTKVRRETENVAIRKACVRYSFHINNQVKSGKIFGTMQDACEPTCSGGTDFIFTLLSFSYCVWGEGKRETMRVLLGRRKPNGRTISIISRSSLACFSAIFARTASTLTPASEASWNEMVEKKI